MSCGVVEGNTVALVVVGCVDVGESAVVVGIGSATCHFLEACNCSAVEICSAAWLY